MERFMGKSKTHLISVRVNDEIHHEIEGLLSLLSKNKPDFLRDILIRGLHHFRKELFSGSLERIEHSIDRSYHAYNERLIDDDMRNITDRFDQLEALIETLRPPLEKPENNVELPVEKQSKFSKWLNT
jgi:hypothetical protein